jgi:hypothetical protein
MIMMMYIRITPTNSTRIVFTYTSVVVLVYEWCMWLTRIVTIRTCTSYIKYDVLVRYWCSTHHCCTRLAVVLVALFFSASVSLPLFAICCLLSTYTTRTNNGSVICTGYRLYEYNSVTCILLV